MQRWVSVTSGCVLAVAAALELSASVPAYAVSKIPPPSVTPRSFKLVGPDAAQQLLVQLGQAGKKPTYSSHDPRIAKVSETGLVIPVADGATKIRVRTGVTLADVSVTVALKNAAPPSFTRDVQPVLARSGCSSGTCHGKAEGQRGFRLSLFGFDPEFDHEAIVRASGGRRVNRLQPERSLLLQKATSAIPHGGGARITTGSREHRLILRWLAAGAPLSAPAEPALAALEVHPASWAIALGSSQRLIVTAKYADGSRRDVTREARYTSNNPAIIEVEGDGVARSLKIPGAAAVMVNFQGLVATSSLAVPRAGDVPEMPPADNYIDRHVWARLAGLRIRPSAPASDGVFIRRAYLDLLGTLPTSDEVRTFLAECEAEREPHHGDTETRRGAPKAGRTVSSKSNSTPLLQHSTTPTLQHSLAPATAARAKLIDRLLQRPEYADFWALKWADLLRVSKQDLGAKGAYDFYRWIREALAENQPYDRFVRSIVTASGSSAENPPANFFRVLGKPEEAASSISQVFLGVRIECAQCHHHPFEKWSQDDYYGMVGFFSPLKRKADGPQSVLVTAGPPVEVKHPRTGQAVLPHPLGADPAAFKSDEDRRKLLADWMADPRNPFVARALVNRVWAHFLGKGLVDPVDDFRDTNPPSNPELLDALAKDFGSGYDVKRLIRTIMTSRVYQLSGESNPTNADDVQGFSRAYPKRMQAEVLLDAVASATGTSPDLPGLPKGTRAIQVWDSEWATQWQSYFLNVFGRPERTHPCECERSQEPSIVQVLHLMNAPEIQRQITDRRGRARKLAESDRTPDQIVEELFLTSFARYPTPKEKAEGTQLFATNPDRVQVTEDILWALINTMEFVFNH